MHKGALPAIGIRAPLIGREIPRKDTPRVSWDKPDYWEMLIRRSLSRFFMLRALYDKPSHGYRLKEAVRKAAEGCCEPTDAMIYPALKELVEHGYVEVKGEYQGARERKVCSLTPRGVEAYKAAAAAWASVLPQIQDAIDVADKAKPVAS
ncbi:MAG: PadR family transcriptional regulator [Chloroflexi bacterium]|nr:PadR family transcriptional regulator [Chloroflexota bacterium]